MRRAKIVGGVIATVVLVGLALLAVAVGYRVFEPDAEPAAAPPPEVLASTAPTEEEAHRAFLYGRVTAEDGTVYEGRLRFGGDEEAFWDQYFNGAKEENPWAAHVPSERLVERIPIEIFGIRITEWENARNLDRPFMVRFGDLARIEAEGSDLRVTLESGTVFHLDRFGSDDLADGVRVWDRERGVVDLDEWGIRTIELLPTPRLDAVPERLYGTVRTHQGELTGFIRWDRRECVVSDELDGETADGELESFRFDTVRSIARSSREGALVTLADGREVVLSGTPEVGSGSRGFYVDDPRFGRVLVSWDAFVRVDFGPGPVGPAYGDFPPGRPLTGSVTTRDGRLLVGRLVYDLDESETTETLDAPSGGLDYTIPFGRIASIMLPDGGEGGTRGARVILHDGEELELERDGDLGEGNAGMLIFVEGREAPEYVPWSEVARIELVGPPAEYPLLR